MNLINLILLYVLNISTVCHSQLLRLALQRIINNTTFIPSPLLFGDCEPGKCADDTSPFLGVRMIRKAIDQLERCDFKLSAYSEYLGHIELRREIYCDPKTLRGFPGRTCCFPQLPRANFPLMTLYPANSSAFDGTAIPLDWRNPDDVMKLPSSGRIVFLVHGWTEVPLRSGALWVYPTVEAWTKVHQTPVIVVDYSNTSDYQYFQNTANARTMGQAIGFAIVNWQIAERTHLAGFSLGGQMIGEIGKYTQRYGYLIKECVALDPAGPGFDSGASAMHLTPDDCELVQVIHSSSESMPDSLGVMSFQLGSYFHLGSCDFWLNCGRNQAADCQFPILGALMNNVPSHLYPYTIADGCSHYRAPLAYAASVAGKCDFTGYECLNCNDFRLTNGCRVNFQGEQMKLPPFNTCKKQYRKDFYVRTHGNTYPYCPSQSTGIIEQIRTIN